MRLSDYCVRLVTLCGDDASLTTARPPAADGHALKTFHSPLNCKKDTNPVPVRGTRPTSEEFDISENKPTSSGNMFAKMMDPLKTL